MSYIHSSFFKEDQRGPRYADMGPNANTTKIEYAGCRRIGLWLHSIGNKTH